MKPCGPSWWLGDWTSRTGAPPKLNKNQDCRVLPLVCGWEILDLDCSHFNCKSFFVAAIYFSHFYSAILQPYTLAIFTQPFCSHLLHSHFYSAIFAAIYFSHFAAIYFSHFAAIRFSHFAAIHFSHFARHLLQPFLLSHFAAIFTQPFCSHLLQPLLLSPFQRPPFFHHIFAVFVAVLP